MVSFNACLEFFCNVKKYYNKQIYNTTQPTNNAPNLNMPINDITICTVSYNSRSYIELNMELTKYLNRNVKPKWLVVENSPINSKEKFNVEDERFHLIEGDTTLLPQIEGQGSYHHAQGLTKAMLYVKTRYLLIIDPDFFIIKDSWINEVIKHMYSNKLSFFGAPYFPTHKTKYRYFPSVICFFVDLNYVKKERLDFFPELHEMSYFRSLGTYTIAKLVIKSYYEKNKSRIDYNRIKCKKA